MNNINDWKQQQREFGEWLGTYCVLDDSRLIISKKDLYQNYCEHSTESTRAHITLFSKLLFQTIHQIDTIRLNTNRRRINAYRGIELKPLT